MTTDQLARALLRYPPGTTCYIAFGGMAVIPTSVHYGNEYNAWQGCRDFVEITDKPLKRRRRS